MKCPHCFIMFHDSWNTSPIPGVKAGSGDWGVKATLCPNCKEPIVRLGVIQSRSVDGNGRIVAYHLSDSQSFMAHPKFPRRMPVDDAVPESFKNDYEEACNVLSISAKSSAALSRRVLQGILNEQGYKSRNLVDQINDLLQEKNPQKVIPTGIRNTVDAVRNFGNFAAHRISDKTSLQIIDVEPNEAEWCLEIIEALFDHYYIRPAESNKRLSALNQKLQRAGKPLAKSSDGDTVSDYH